MKDNFLKFLSSRKQSFFRNIFAILLALVSAIVVNDDKEFKFVMFAIVITMSIVLPIMCLYWHFYDKGMFDAFYTPKNLYIRDIVLRCSGIFMQYGVISSIILYITPDLKGLLICGLILLIMLFEYFMFFKSLKKYKDS